MKRTFKKAISVFLVVAMLLCAVPLNGFIGLELPSFFDFKAEAATYSGTCGDNLNWSLDTETGALNITGTGAMTNYTYDSVAPWYSYRSNIKTVNIASGATTIGNYAFEGCDSLTSVTIPDSVTRIGNYAFDECTSLTSITIPDSVTTIGEHAISGCYRLTSVTIGNSVTNIGQGVFSCCSSLTSITIPDSVKSIGYYAFYSCDSLTSVTIPDSVTTIGDGAFEDCDSLTNVTIGSGVTAIDEDAFACCYRLTSITVDEDNKYFSSNSYGVLFNKDKTTLIQYPIGNTRTSYTIPDSVTTIGDNAFAWCISLTSVTIPDGVTTIGDYAFDWCDSLTSVTIPDSVTTIGEGAFYDCYSLTDVYYGSTEEDWNKITIGSDNECLTNAIIHFTEPTIASGTCGDNLAWTLYESGLLEITGTGAMTNYSSSSSIPWYSYRSDIKTINIASGVTTIGNYAFYDCYNLTSVTISDSVTTIGDYAFSGCENLTSVTIPDSVTTIGDCSFCDCESLTSVTIGDSVTTIGYNAFGGCYNLTSITIPDSVTTIDSGAFKRCSSLETVYIGKGLRAVGNTAFIESSVADIIIDSENPYLSADVIDQHYIVWFNKDRTVLISYSPYDYNMSYGEYTIPSTVKVIGDNAFDYVRAIPCVNIPNSVTTIGNNAFSYCESITEIWIPDSVTTIGDSAFAHSGIKSIIIPSNVTHIGESFFSGSEIYIRGTSAVFDPDAFDYCGSADIYYFGTQTQWAAAFKGSLPSAINVYFPEFGKCGDNLDWYIDKNKQLIISGSGAMYDFAEGSAPWADYASQITAVSFEGVTKIGSYAFSGFTKLEEVSVLYGVKEIGAYAFNGCTSLKSVSLKDSLTSVGAHVFNACSLLTDIYFEGSQDKWDAAFNGTLPGTVTVHCNYVSGSCNANVKWYFSNDTLVIYGNGAMDDYGYDSYDNYILAPWEYLDYDYNIKHIIIEEGITHIGSEAFYDDEIISITIPSTVVSIGTYVFVNYEYSDYDVYFTGSMTQWCSIGFYSTYFHEGINNLYISGQLIAGDLVIPDDVTSLRSEAFAYCDAITSVTIPESIKMIGSYAFRDCDNLTTVTIYQGVETIDNGAFDNCKSLTTITIPDSVTSIDYSAFDDCDNLTDVYYGGTQEDWNKIKIGSYNAALTSATIHYNWVIHNHDYTWVVETVPTTTQSGSKKEVCTICGKTKGESVEIPATSFETTNGMVVDYASNMVFGLTAGISSLEGFATVVVDGCELEYVEGKNGFGTGTKAVIKNGDEIIEEYTIVIFGDIQGDGWYDANDAFLVNMMAIGLLDESKLSDAEKAAADCNHDGVINELDFELLINASVLLEDVDQSATQPELATQSAYIEYMSIIDQSAGLDVEDTAPETDKTVESAEPAEDFDFGSFLAQIFLFIRKIFNLVFSFAIK